MILTEKNFSSFNGVEIRAKDLSVEISYKRGWLLYRNGENNTVVSVCPMICKNKVFYYDRKDIL